MRTQEGLGAAETSVHKTSSPEEVRDRPGYPRARKPLENRVWSFGERFALSRAGLIKSPWARLLEGREGEMGGETGSDSEQEGPPGEMGVWLFEGTHEPGCRGGKGR